MTTIHEAELIPMRERLANILNLTYDVVDRALAQEEDEGYEFAYGVYSGMLFEDLAMVVDQSGPNSLLTNRIVRVVRDMLTRDPQINF